MRTRRLLLALAGIALVLAACSGGASDYGNDTEGAFMESCTVNQQQPQAVCKCTYDQIRQQYPFSRYVELDKQLQKDPKAVPDDLLRIVADCASQATSTTTTTTLPPPPSSSFSSFPFSTSSSFPFSSSSSPPFSSSSSFSSSSAPPPN